MKLYVYDHCPFCTKARMIFGLKSLPLELDYVLENDVDTPTRLIGKKATPILRKEDGSHMAESMDIVHYIDGLDDNPVVTAVENSAIKGWHDAAWRPILELAIPRMASANLPELGTEEAREAYTVRQTKNFGDFDELLKRTPEQVANIKAQLAELDKLVDGRNQIDADDFILYPSLRMLSIVKDVTWPANVQCYLQRLEQATGVPLHTEIAR